MGIRFLPALHLSHLFQVLLALNLEDDPPREPGQPPALESPRSLRPHHREHRPAQLGSPFTLLDAQRRNI